MEDKKQQTSASTNAETQAIVSKEKLLEAGAYFGHKTSFRNPNMKPYIHMAKYGTHIIDLLKTTKALEFAYNIINKSASKNASFIFVGTKKQAKTTIVENAKRVNAYYVSERWLGGTFTNHEEIFKRVKVLEQIERLAETGYAGYSKKEAALWMKKLARLETNLSGIRTMKYAPHIMIVADPLENMNAIREARQKGIKIIGIADTNFDPNLLDIAIPANDDSVKSITLIITVLADAIATAQGQKALFAFQPDANIVFDDSSSPKTPKQNNRPQRVQRENWTPRANRERGRDGENR